jgi:rhodanese-related sulfurtransferase
MSPSLPEIRRPSRVSWVMVALLVFAGGAIPVVFYYCLLGKLPTLMPHEARAMLQQKKNSGELSAMLVDVRPAEVFSTRHLDGAVNWPLAKIMKVNQKEILPAEFENKKLILICDVGWSSGRAVRHLSSLGLSDIYQSRGGIQEWIHEFKPEKLEFQPANLPPEQAFKAEPVPPKGERFDRFRIAGDRVEQLPFRNSPIYEQLLAVLAFFFFKPIYELLSFLVIVFLWKSREPDLTALRWAMIFFFLGENACAVNYFVFQESSYLAEYLHGYGMMLCFAFASFALVEGLDRRVLFFSNANEKCSAVALCRKCSKHGEASCGLVQLFRVLVAGLLIVSFMLLTADRQNTAYNTVVFRHFYHYGHFWIHQAHEYLVCGVGAAFMFFVSFALLFIKHETALKWSKFTFSAGLGALAFGGLRMIIGTAYDQNRVWFLFWEETTELLFIAMVCCVLAIFREGLMFKIRSKD